MKQIKEYTESLRVEFFDERFYKIQLPENYNTEKFKYQNLLNITETGIYIYLPSVTTYLSSIQDNQLIRWRGEVGNELADRKMNSGAELGSAIHRAIQMRCNGYDVIYSNPKHITETEQNISQYAKEVNPKIYIIESQEVAVQLARFEKVMEILEYPEIIEVEKTVYSVKELYAGTLDMVISLKNNITFTQGRNEYSLKKGKYIIDIKTGKYINEIKYFSQLAAYGKAYGGNYKGALILHLNANIKSGIEGFKPYYKTKNELKEYYNYFKRVRDNYLFELDNFKVTNYEIPIYFNHKLNRKEN